MSTTAAELRVHLEPRHLQIVAGILREHLPGREVGVFGSRATGIRLKQFSDLDLAVRGGLTVAEAGALADAFEESMLPIKVDVVALDGVSPEFRERIEKDFVGIQVA
jgi:predicted nucleotidyltransferase